MEIWDLWYLAAAAQGLPFSRSRIEPTDMVFVHAAPDVLRVEIRSEDGAMLAIADQLRRTSVKALPMTRLRRRDNTVVRSDEWPSESDVGAVVLLAGGEAGVLRSWWLAPDAQEWRWTLEFYNHA